MLSNYTYKSKSNEILNNLTNSNFWTHRYNTEPYKVYVFANIHENEKS